MTGPARVVPRRPGNDHYVILDRVDDLDQAATAYCIHGRAMCVRCGAWCWLGSATYELVAAGDAGPVCHPCARQVIPPGPLGVLPLRVGNAGDHLRQDGPHD